MEIVGSSDRGDLGHFSVCSSATFRSDRQHSSAQSSASLSGCFKFLFSSRAPWENSTDCKQKIQVRCAIAVLIMYNFTHTWNNWSPSHPFSYTLQNNIAVTIFLSLADTFVSSSVYWSDRVSLSNWGSLSPCGWHDCFVQRRKWEPTLGRFPG